MNKGVAYNKKHLLAHKQLKYYRRNYYINLWYYVYLNNRVGNIFLQ